MKSFVVHAHKLFFIDVDRQKKLIEIKKQEENRGLWMYKCEKNIEKQKSISYITHIFLYINYLFSRSIQTNASIIGIAKSVKVPNSSSIFVSALKWYHLFSSKVELFFDLINAAKYNLLM